MRVVSFKRVGYRVKNLNINGNVLPPFQGHSVATLERAGLVNIYSESDLKDLKAILRALLLN